MVATQAKVWQGAAVAYTVAAWMFFAFMPVFPAQTASGVFWVSPFSVLGWPVFVPLLVPLAVAALPLLVRRGRVRVGWICTAVLAAICLIWALSYGLLFAPAAAFTAFSTHLAARAPIEDEDNKDAPWRVPKA
jgi:hypothetical protein